MELKLAIVIPVELMPHLGDRGTSEQLHDDGRIESDDLRASVDFHGGSILLEGNDQIRFRENGDWEIWKFIQNVSFFA